MKVNEDLQVILSVIVASAVSLSMVAVSMLWVDRGLASFIRGTSWDFLFLISILLVFAGSGWLWWQVYMRVNKFLGGRE